MEIVDHYEQAIHKTSLKKLFKNYSIGHILNAYKTVVLSNETTLNSELYRSAGSIFLC